MLEKLGCFGKLPKINVSEILDEIWIRQRTVLRLTEQLNQHTTGPSFCSGLFFVLRIFEKSVI